MGIKTSSSQLPHQARKQKTRTRTALKLGCWNVRTMLAGLSENLQDISDSRKTAVINDEVNRVNVDIATPRETRLADSDSLKEKDYTFYYSKDYNYKLNRQLERRFANEYRTEFSEVTQTTAITGMYDDIKKALGPAQSNTAPLKHLSETCCSMMTQQ